MNCKKTCRLLSACQDGELNSGLEHELELHLRDCRACQAEWHGLQELAGSLKISPPAADPYFPARVMAGLPADRSGKFRLLSTAGYALVFLAIFLGGFFLQLTFDGNAALTKPQAVTFSSVLLENQDLGLLTVHDATLDLFERPRP